MIFWYTIYSHTPLEATTASAASLTFIQYSIATQLLSKLHPANTYRITSEPCSLYTLLNYACTTHNLTIMGQGGGFMSSYVKQQQNMPINPMLPNDTLLIRHQVACEKTFSTSFIPQPIENNTFVHSHSGNSTKNNLHGWYIPLT